jgi:hypothetical protein
MEELMHSRPLSYSAEEHLEDVGFHIARVKPDPQAAVVLPAAEAAYGGLKSRIEEWKTKQYAVTSAQNALVAADDLLDEVITATYHTILEDCHNDHHDPKFMLYFPRGLGAYTRVPYRDEVVADNGLADRCSRDASPKIQERAAVIRAETEKVAAAMRAREEALTAEAAAYGELQVQKLASVDTLRASSHQLSMIYSHQPDKVRAFFREFVHPKPPVKEVPTTATTPAGGRS